jgi:cell division protein FtsI/penicillin-binding protein 2
MPSSPPAARRALALAAVLAACAAAVAWLLLRGPSAEERARDGATAAAQAFLADWSRGADDVAAARTDRPRLAAPALAASRRGLDGARVSAELTGLDLAGDLASARARVRVRWLVPRIGPWSYTTTVPLRPAGEAWRVAWRPTVVHPALSEVTRLGTQVTAPPRAPILDRRGRALVRPRPVVAVGVVAGEVRSAPGRVAEVARLLGVDGAALARAVRRAGREQLVPVVTLRRPEYERVAGTLRTTPGVVAVGDTAPLAPTRAFARALLGTVGPVTAEQLRRLGPGYAPGDQVGQWGLQAAFDRQLAGRPDRAVVVRLRDRGAGVTRTLLERPGVTGPPLRTTLDARVQAAAEAALGDGEAGAALVAVQPSSGDLLAVANRPVDSSFDRALAGLYPPGSTFKVVTTAALLRAGLDPQATVPCPPTATVGGRAFRNFEGSAAGAVPFTVDFAQSCNTAFVSLAPRLAPGALRDAAASFGLGRSFRLPVAAAGGDVPVARPPVERAAAMIGQARIVASPLAMAGVAATVAAGRWHAPRLVAGDPRRAAPPLPAGELATLRALMRRVVTAGTGTALAGVPGAVAGKSGTAEYGSGDPPPTHAWFIAYRGDLALAVLVEDGRSGGSVAAPIAARFFRALDG